MLDIIDITSETRLGGDELDYKQLSSEQRLKMFKDPKERSIAEYLENKGHIVVVNKLQGVPGAGRQGDAFVDELKTEFKSLNVNATSSTIRNEVNNSISEEGQARRFVIDARGTELTKEEAERGVFRALGISRGKVDYIEVIGRDYFFGYAPKN